MKRENANIDAGWDSSGESRVLAPADCQTQVGLRNVRKLILAGIFTRQQLP